MVKTILVFDLVVFDSILILNLVIPKTYSISVVSSCFFDLANLVQIYEILRENTYLLKNIATILFILQYLLLY